MTGREEEGGNSRAQNPGQLDSEFVQSQLTTTLGRCSYDSAAPSSGGVPGCAGNSDFSTSFSALAGGRKEGVEVESSVPLGELERKFKGQERQELLPRAGGALGS